MTNASRSIAISGQSSTKLSPQFEQGNAPHALEKSALHSLAALWARKYIISLTTRDEAEKIRRNKNLTEVTSREGRENTAQTLTQSLTLASAQAWSKTEMLLSDEVKRHGINPDLINPWQIAEDSHRLFQRALEAYSNRLTARRLSVIVGTDFGRMRRKYTAHDPRTLGFVSMQFHYTGMMLLEQLSPPERALFAPYVKVMDDHLYMPLRDAYEAAANYELDSPLLIAVQKLLPISTRIAHAVCNQVCRLRPDYESYSGPLGSTVVRTSSVRDVEMFQVYLCLCVLENSIRSVQQELFPLCVMLYPRLGVRWELVQEMLRMMGWEMHDRLAPDYLSVFLPYLRALTEMFALDVFQTV
ncbi:hypothetical protein K9N68_33030 [Kovacikia minuta CCNUW1]|uniref:hypothetical protein n=1 Tax=Kovacikia minuta TaxID=2931930 RepID=UPI001CCD4977|nr:hypothetical protein [Kovacikia minuta]UBF26277.1 hypothetical protein K9N68_33030 [Kovacikia minuta CCNUW1]